MDYELTYAGTVEEGAALTERIRSETARSGDFRLGFDTEFYDVEIGKHSVLGRAKVHFASLSWDPGGGRLHPRGFTVPHAAVVSREVVRECAPFRRLFEEGTFTWLAHNAPVDAHTFRNEGIYVRNIVNTLTRARWCWPSRARMSSGGGGFGLDALGKDVIGEGKIAHFDEVFSEVVIERKPVSTTVCECGTPKCRKRSCGHVKTKSISYTEHDVVLPVPLQDVTPGHRLFEAAIRYSAQDAVIAKCLDQVITRELKRQERVVPWLVMTKAS